MKSLEESLQKVDLLGEVWIVKDSRIFRKVYIKMKFEDEYSSSEFNNTFELKNYNQPVDIEEPADYMTISDLLELLGANMDSTSFNASSPSNAKVIADIKQLQTALELYFNDHQDSYPLPPIGGNKIGLNARILSFDGFANNVSSDEQFSVYMSDLPSHPDLSLIHI